MFGFEPEGELSLIHADTGYHPKLFNPDDIGRNKYNAARVSVSRAINRLQKRGLCIRANNGGLWLTADGIAMAVELSASTESNHKNVNR